MFSCYFWILSSPVYLPSRYRRVRSRLAAVVTLEGFIFSKTSQPQDNFPSLHTQVARQFLCFDGTYYSFFSCHFHTNRIYLCICILEKSLRDFHPCIVIYITIDLCIHTLSWMRKVRNEPWCGSVREVESGGGPPEAGRRIKPSWSEGEKWESGLAADKKNL